MRKGFWILGLMLMSIVVLSACGAKSQEDVTASLNKKVGELKGYKAEAKMTLTVGDEPQTYDIEVWHAKPGNYRVHLKNANKDQSQMILRNKNGVFVLTPALNKSYRFQSEWPENSSQAYLFESLVKDIMEDKEAGFKAGKDQFVFQTKTRYQNSKMLPSQEITLKKGTLEPVSVKVLDHNESPVVTVEFSKFEFDAKFDSNAFDTKKNMTSAQLDIPVLKNVSNDDNEDFAVKYSMAEIPGVELQDETEMTTENGKRVILTYAGEDKSFTIFQEASEINPTSSMEVIPVSGEMVDFGFSVGAMTEGSISWTDQGVDYLLVSNDLTPEEMLMVAKSVQGGAVK
ncbi:LolA family protein [Lederbergia galactosidilytica]|uniref:Sporulation protein n=1 Tax=Lederbergia galactosidilytica TaxID=217031 RepID=A0A178A6J4_9BACI|nr:outer membrane lipoprotein carrier protein LolA [Lederbergia galactosidilytica]KRG16236.1 sporulation protein [Virgibacillus soli]MBP1914091.1 outer membrane lipoprotein-sorting protein [Lederbergia galactosidilytica]OAK75664.1 sporulation protein [Lederbergia galactosidilytica]